MNYGNSSEYEKAARELLFGGKPQQALDLFDEGLRKYPADFGLLLGRGMSLNDLHRPAEARDVFVAVITAAPQMTDALQGLTEAELALGNRKAAVEAARKACDRPEETNADFVHELALVLFKNELFADAERCYRRAVGIDRAHGHSWVGLAACLRSQGKRDEAISLLKEAVIDRLPGFWEGYSYLGCMLFDAGRAEEAGAILAKIPLDELRDPAAAQRLRAALNVERFPERARILKEIEKRAAALLPRAKPASSPPPDLGTFIVGPVRGDYPRLLKILQHIRLVDEKANWCGVNVRLILLGPFIKERKGNLKALRFSEKLKKQAKRQKGDGSVVVLVADPRETYYYEGWRVHREKGSAALPAEPSFSHTAYDWRVSVQGVSSTKTQELSDRLHARLREKYPPGGGAYMAHAIEFNREMAASVNQCYISGIPAFEIESSAILGQQIISAEGDPAARAERFGEKLIRLDSGLGDGTRLLCLHSDGDAWEAVELPLAQERFIALKGRFYKCFGYELPAALEFDPETEPLHPGSDDWLAFSRAAQSENVRLPVFEDNLKEAPSGTWLLGFWGYGANSYAFYLARKDKKREVFLRLFYGGVYGNPERDAVEVRTFLQRYVAFEEWAASNLERWNIVNSMGSCGGWILRRGSTVREELLAGHERQFRFPNETGKPGQEIICERSIMNQAHTDANEKNAQEPQVSRKTDIVAIGDLHGSMKALIEIVRYANLLETHWESGWVGGNTIVVQTGDVIDRGPCSLEVYDALGRFQEKAEANGGKVVRLIGNHELYILQGKFRATNLKDPAAFREKLVADILSGKLQGGFAAQRFLFTHAGVRSSILESLLEESGKVGPADITPLVALAINRILVEAVKSGDWSHPIFHVGVARGGSHSVGGVFWEDRSKMFESAGAGRIKQVFGHTPGKEIAVDSSGRLADIDVGMVFGGPAQYLRIRNGKLSPRTVVEGEFERRLPSGRKTLR